MSYFRGPGQGRRIYEPHSWVEEQEELKLIQGQPQKRRAIKPPDPVPQSTRMLARAAMKHLFHLFLWSGVTALCLASANLMASTPL